MGTLLVDKACLSQQLVGQDELRRMLAHTSLLVWLLSRIFQIHGSYVIEKRSLMILHPSSIEGKYDTAFSSFGRPAYAGSVLGAVQVPPLGETACTAFRRFGVAFQRSGNDYRHSAIALLESDGDCDFAWKVYNAQNAGAVAALIVDHKHQPLEVFADGDLAAMPLKGHYLDNITIPSVLVNKTVGDLMKRELSGAGGAVNVKLEWTEAPKEPVDYEMWTISQDKCGDNCDTQVQFVKDFRGIAQNLEKGGYTVFTPHYIVWFCPAKYMDSDECKSQCINNGRYCSPDPEYDFSVGYEGKDVVIENLRQICIHKVLAEQERSWIWWDYVADFQVRCSMKEGKYGPDCGNAVASSLGLNSSQIMDCMGDPAEDEENELLKAEQEGQAAKGGERGDITIIPTLVISNKQYKGKLENEVVLNSLCSQFVEGEEPSLCLDGSMETDECLVNNGGCWISSNALMSACRDTYKGRVCECPFYQGVALGGDGYTFCEPIGPGRCKIDNAGCWQETRGNASFSACSDTQSKGCTCPEGFTGDGVHACDNINECSKRTRCQCKECTCADTWGSYDCSCSGDLIYLRENDDCVRKKATTERVFWFSFGLLGFAVLTTVTAGFLMYKYKVRSYMDSRIRSTLAQYMPLDSSNQEIYRHLQEG